MYSIYLLWHTICLRDCSHVFYKRVTIDDVHVCYFQAYFFEDDSDEHSGSDISPLVRRPPAQSTSNIPHSHIFTGYLSAVEVLVLVRDNREGGEKNCNAVGSYPVERNVLCQ